MVVYEKMWMACVLTEVCHVALQYCTYYIERATVAVLMQVRGKIYFRFHTSGLAHRCAVNRMIRGVRGDARYALSCFTKPMFVCGCARSLEMLTTDQTTTM
jgi:hypothetical protein